jgi:nicotinamide-nucleotide amidase
MLAELISIGDELLIGQVINTNAAWIAIQLNNIGVDIKQISVISDERQHIISALDDAKKRADLIITTGGIGPTSDDITKQTLCEYFNTRLVFNEEAYKDIQELFKKRNYPVTESNKKQAELPENCISIKNHNGTARGMWFKKEGKIFISLPGVPFEMKAMITEYIIPKLQSHISNLSSQIPDFIIHKNILTQGIGESFLSEKIAEWESALPRDIKLAYLPSPGIVRLRLTAKGNDKNKLTELINSQISKLKSLISDYIYGYDNDTLEEIIGKLLNEKGRTLSTAESCTGGYIAHRITSVTGSSNYYTGSVIAYSNLIKENILKVSPDIINKYGAVSEEVVREMAANVRALFKTDYSVAVSGIAGPDGGTPEKPVGTTWIAIATPQIVYAQKFLFGDNRERNIIRTSLTALNMLRKQILLEN